MNPVRESYRFTVKLLALLTPRVVVTVRRTLPYRALAGATRGRAAGLGGADVGARGRVTLGAHARLRTGRDRAPPASYWIGRE